MTRLTLLLLLSSALAAESPQVVLVSPVPGSVVSGTISLVALVPVGTVRVVFYCDGVAIGEGVPVKVPGTVGMKGVKVLGAP